MHLCIELLYKYSLLHSSHSQFELFTIKQCWVLVHFLSCNDKKNPDEHSIHIPFSEILQFLVFEHLLSAPK